MLNKRELLHNYWAWEQKTEAVLEFVSNADLRDIIMDFARIDSSTHYVTKIYDVRLFISIPNICINEILFVISLYVLHTSLHASCSVCWKHLLKILHKILVMLCFFFSF